jgi:hypothetical protein
MTPDDEEDRPPSSTLRLDQAEIARRVRATLKRSTDDTLIECPACAPPAKLACRVCDGLGVVTVIARGQWLRAQGPRTLVRCPQCSGVGYLRTMDASGHTTQTVCSLCEGDGATTPFIAEAFKR